MKIKDLIVVPREPTDAMMMAAIAKGQEVGYTDIIAVWRAMVKAAQEDELTGNSR